MKKLLAIAFALTLALSLSACSSKPTASPGNLQSDTENIWYITAYDPETFTATLINDKLETGSVVIETDSRPLPTQEMKFINNIYKLEDPDKNGEFSAVQLETETSITWYEKTAALEYIPSMASLATIYAPPNPNGHEDFSRAVYWGEKAVDNGSTSVYSYLGRACEGLGSYEDAFEWYKLAADSTNDPFGGFKAYRYVALLYWNEYLPPETGDAASKDTGLKYMMQVANQTKVDCTAASYVGQWYLTGVLTPPTGRTIGDMAVEYFEKASANDNGHGSPPGCEIALSTLADIYETGLNGQFPELIGLAKAKAVYEKMVGSNYYPDNQDYKDGLARVTTALKK